MTTAEFTRHLPPLTNNPLSVKPPFTFNGVAARIFPLRASLDSLQQLCNSYLNFVPPEAGRFRAIAPYVMLMALDYGQISETSRAGWFGQMEVFFCVPVEWYKLVHGRWVFHGWAVFTPYIFVTDSYSVPVGREVYGFPKVLAELTPAPNNWIVDPMAPVTLARFETAVFPEAYAGKRLQTKVLLEIERAAPMLNFRVPPDPSSPMMPWVMASNFAQAMGELSRDALWMAQAMRIFRMSPGLNPAFFPEMLARLMPAFAAGGRGFIQNSINLKQFRRADLPDRLCYQALTNGQMTTTGFNGGGLMGEERTFLGDFSGGHVIRLYDQSSLPITRILGLEVSRHWQGQDSAVDELKPVFPFWINVNLLYQPGVNLAWRTDDGPWRDAGGALLNPHQRPAAPGDGPEYNCTVTSAVEAITGPFEFSDTTVRVLPLLARLEALQQFLQGSVNDLFQNPIAAPDGTQVRVRLSVWARPPAFVGAWQDAEPIGGDLAYVYMTASSFGDVLSKTNNVGDWAKYELAFLIPVKWERCGADGQWETIGVGMYPAFTFVDNCTAAISRCEVQGINTGTAIFVRPESAWLQEGATELESEQTLLVVNTEVLPALAAGQKGRVETIFEIRQREPNAGLGNPESRDTAYLWSETLRLELGTKKGTKQRFRDDFQMARALSLELLGNQTPFALYTLKEFRDAHDPDKACYQELLRVPRVLKELLDLREIEETIVIHFHDFPSLKIAETLGIVAPNLVNCGEGLGIVYSAQAIRPFYVRGTVLEPLAERLAVRAGTEPWTLSPAALQSILSGADDQPPVITADIGAEQAQNTRDSCQLAFVMFQARSRLLQGSAGRTAISKKQAREALAVIDPQMVIEAILSREWGNFDENCHWRRGRRDLLKSLKALPEGGPWKSIAESKLYRTVNNLAASRPGAVASRMDVKGFKLSTTPPDSDSWRRDLALMLDEEIQFTEAQISLEEAYNSLAPWLMLGGREFQNAASELENPLPGEEERKKAAQQLMDALDFIAKKLTVRVEPSDGPVQAGQLRLTYLLDVLRDKLILLPDFSTGVRVEDVVEAVQLARNYCGAQREAILNRLARAYQKPDFCIRLDSLGTASSSLLEPALAWDGDWYYGTDVFIGQITPQTFPPDFRGDPTRRNLIGPLLPT
jgi:hypothetical protein